MELLDSESKLMKALREHSERLEAVRKLPAYQEYLNVKQEYDGFLKFMHLRRLAKTYDLITELTTETWGPEEAERIQKVNAWLDRLSNHRNKQATRAQKRGYTYCDTRVMDHVWEVFSIHGREVLTTSDFGGQAFQIGNYTMEIYHGQGEYGYSITYPKRIY